MNYKSPFSIKFIEKLPLEEKKIKFNDLSHLGIYDQLIKLRLKKDKLSRQIN